MHGESGHESETRKSGHFGLRIIEGFTGPALRVANPPSAGGQGRPGQVLGELGHVFAQRVRRRRGTSRQSRHFWSRATLGIRSPTDLEKELTLPEVILAEQTLINTGRTEKITVVIEPRTLHRRWTTVRPNMEVETELVMAVVEMHNNKRVLTNGQKKQFTKELQDVKARGQHLWGVLRSTKQQARP